MKYKVLRTQTADACIRRIILYVERQFGLETALEKLNKLEHDIMMLEDNPYLGIDPRYPILKKMGYRVLILEKNLAFYKINEMHKEVVVYAVFDQREDYLNIIKGL